jgi:hypothetical protein
MGPTEALERRLIAALRSRGIYDLDAVADELEKTR